MLLQPVGGHHDRIGRKPLLFSVSGVWSHRVTRTSADPFAGHVVLLVAAGLRRPHRLPSINALGKSELFPPPIRRAGRGSRPRAGEFGVRRYRTLIYQALRPPSRCRSSSATCVCIAVHWGDLFFLKNKATTYLTASRARRSCLRAVTSSGRPARASP